jgi:hypothetical protein
LSIEHTVSSLLSSAMAVGCALSVSALWLYALNRRTASWPVTEGVVTRSRVACDPDTGHCDVEFSYAFRVASTLHHASRIAYAPCWPFARTAHDMLAQYPVGRRVTVAYDPQCPTNAVIERYEHHQAYALAALGVSVALAASPAVWS